MRGYVTKKGAQHAATFAKGARACSQSKQPGRTSPAILVRIRARHSVRSLRAFTPSRPAKAGTRAHADALYPRPRGWTPSPSLDRPYPLLLIRGGPEISGSENAEGAQF